MHARKAVVVVLALALPALVAQARESDAERKTAAQRFYDSGMLLYDRGQFIDAAKEFERAYAELPSPAMLYNIAQAYDKGGDRQKAVENYRKYVKAAPDAKDNAVAASRADVLEREWKELEAARQAQPTRRLPPPLPFVEPVTHYTYQTWTTVDGKPYTLLGAGARKVAWFKVYSMGLYVEDAPARARFPELAAKAGGSDHDSLVRGDLANEWVVLGDFGKMALLHFVRNVTAKETRDSYREALGPDASQNAPDDVRRAVDQFLNLFGDVKDGDNLVIRTRPDGQIIVEAGGKTLLGPKNQRLSHDIWDIWMGEKPIYRKLKRTLIDRIDTLGR